MARTISNSVGRMGGKNAPQDVVTVQQLLNQVPVGEGGPVPGLDVDGLCGTKTTTAIQKFQLKHFGWSGADGRVDPNGPTLAKLNTYDGRVFAPAPITVETNMACPHRGKVKATSQRGTHVLTTSDKYVVTGCTLPGSPCVKVQWLGPPGKPLNETTPGICVSGAGLPQGPVRLT